MDSAAVVNKDAIINGGSTKKNDPKETNGEKAKEARKVAPRRPPPPKPDNPAKFKVKKEDVYCHFGVFMTMLFIYFTSVYMSSKKKVAPKPSIFSEIESAVNNVHLDSFVKPQLPLNQNIQVRKSIDDSGTDTDTDSGCTLHIADSSMPNSGLGLFSMSSVELGNEVVPSGATVNIRGVEMSPYIMLIKHHPAFSNVNGGIGGAPIVASKYIEEGEEIFINLEEYPADFQKIYHDANPSHLTTTIFDKVDNITQKVIDAIPFISVQIKPKKKQYKQKNKKVKFVQKPAIDATPLIQVIKEIQKEYDPVIADLIPDSHAEATSMIEAGGRAKYISNKRSLIWLSKGGLCVNGVMPLSNIDGVATTRPIKKGDVVITSPVYASSTGEGNRGCWIVKEGALTLCPLSFASQINGGIPASQCDTESSEKCPHNMANVQYQWSEFNDLNKNIESMSMSDLLAKPLTGLTIDVIALRDLDENEEVLIDYSSGAEKDDSNLRLRKDMIPNAWK